MDRRVIVDQQNLRLPGEDFCPVGEHARGLVNLGLLRLLRRQFRRHAQCENGAMPEFAFDRRVAADHPAELPRNRQPQSRAAKFSRRGSIGLGKRLEHFSHLLRCHAHPGVAHPEDHPIDAAFRLACDFKPHCAILGKFARIAEQIEKTLPHLRHVGVHRAKVGLRGDFEMVAVLFHDRRHRRRDVFDHVSHVERLRVQIHLPSLDLGNVEHPIDQRQQMLACRFDLRQIADEARQRKILGLLPHQFAIADDRVERRAQLMAHVRQELALRAARFLGCFLGAAQFLFRPLPAL